MKKNLFLLILVLISMASCHTYEKIVYLQDAVPNEAVPAAQNVVLKLMPGDKIGVIVTSSATPQLAARYNITTGSNYSSQQNTDNMRYVVDENGCIDMLGVGRIEVAGLTRAEAAAKIQGLFRNGILNDAVVTVAAYSRFVTVLGDVSRPGKQEFERENMTILEAIGKAGDLNITGRRDCIKVIRQEGNESKTYYVDLRSKDIFRSPVYYLKQNDVIYVEPNKVKMGQSTNNDNSVRSINTWLSISSFLLSLSILIFR